MAISDLPGDINQAKKRTRPSDLNMTFDRPVRTPEASPLGKDLPRIPLPSEMIGAASKTLSIGAGQIADAGTNLMVRAAGGDPTTRRGGADAMTQMGGRAGQAVQDYSAAIMRAPQSAILGLSGAIPQAAAQPGGAEPVAAPAPQPQVAQAPAVEQPQVAAQPQAVTPAAQSPYQQTSVPGAVSRRGADGVMEFTDRPDAVQGARPSDKQSGGTFSVVSGGREAMAQNLLATEIMQQTSRERSNPVPMTVVRDSGKSGMEGELNRRENQRTSENNRQIRDNNQQQIAGGSARIASLQAGLQQVAQGDRSAEAEQRIQDLQSRIADPRLSEEERAQAERSFQALTVSGKDRYMLQDVILGEDAMGAPLIGRVALDTLTGQQVGSPQERGVQQAGRTVTRAEVAAKAKAEGISEAEVIELARRNGIEVAN